MGIKTSIDSSWWVDRDYSNNARLLYLYLISNSHTNPARIYKISRRTMANETGIPLSQVSELLKELTGDVQWYEGENVIWIRDYLESACKNASWLIGALKAVGDDIKWREITLPFFDHNQGLIDRYFPEGINGDNEGKKYPTIASSWCGKCNRPAFGCKCKKGGVK